MLSNWSFQKSVCFIAAKIRSYLISIPRAIPFYIKCLPFRIYFPKEIFSRLYSTVYIEQKSDCKREECLNSIPRVLDPAAYSHSWASQRQHRLFQAGSKFHPRSYPLSFSSCFFVFVFLLHSMPSPGGNFSTRDISHYEWGATGTIFPSSCYPVSFFAVARPCDLSFAATRFYPSLAHSFSTILFRLPWRSVAATSAPLHHSWQRWSPPSIGIRGRRFFRAYFRYVPTSCAARIFSPGSDSS